MRWAARPKDVHRSTDSAFNAYDHSMSRPFPLFAALACLCFVFSDAALAQSTDREAKAAEEAVRSFHEALQLGDEAAVKRLLAPDAVILESGSLETRDEYLRHHLKADIEFNRSVPTEVSAVTATVSGLTAWVRSTSVSQGTFRDRPIKVAGAELMVLTRGAAGWEIRAIHWSSHNVK